VLNTHSVKIAVVPTKRAHLSIEEACKQKKSIFDQIRRIKGENVEIIDIDDVNEYGILWNYNEAYKAIKKLKNMEIDGLFIPHCDFGTEEVVGILGKEMKVPLLIWGPRDEGPDEVTGDRKRDTQCGIFASSKVLQRYRVPFSYIVNSAVDSSKFMSGFLKFCGVVSVVKSFSRLRIGQIGTRPKPFMSVICNEDELLNKFGIEIVPISIFDIMKSVDNILKEEPEQFSHWLQDIQTRIDCASMDEASVKKIVALKFALLKALEDNQCIAAALECWSLFPKAMGILPCLVVSELTNMGIPVACETDIHGAITSILVQAAAMGTTPTFFADLTIRHPENDNAELLWHCGPFPYSIKSPQSPARLENGRAQWSLKNGDITIARFDSLEGQYFLFAGEGRGIDGPKTIGTYLWFEVDHWEKWEEKFIFGPYIHHVVGIHGKYAHILNEACKFIPGLKADSIEPFPLSL